MLISNLSSEHIITLELDSIIKPLLQVEPSHPVRHSHLPGAVHIPPFRHDGLQIAT